MKGNEINPSETEATQIKGINPSQMRGNQPDPNETKPT
jgi:hypothetical protein